MEEAKKYVAELNKEYKEVYRRFTKSGNYSPDFYAFCNGRKDVYYLRLFLDQKPQLHATVTAGLPYSCALTSDKPIPSAMPTPRKRKDDSESRTTKDSYESVVVRESGTVMKQECKNNKEYIRGIRFEQARITK